MSKSSLWLTVGEGRDIGNHDCDDVTRAGLGIPDGIYRISTPLPMDLAPRGFTFNQYLVVDEEPLLLHTGPDEMITAYLVDGRIISVPLAWSWRLAAASPAQRANYEIIGDGEAVHWPDVDEDISADGMLAGTPARPPKQKRD
jgi:hypothetical protein